MGRRWAAWLGAFCLATLLTPTRALGEELVIALGGDIAYPSDALRGDDLDRAGVALFAEIQPILEGADLRFANLECPVTDQPARQDAAFPMTCSPRRAGYVLDAGFDLLSLANNHITDAGLAGVLGTIDELERRARQRPLWWAGAGASRAQATKSVVARPAGKSTTVAFFAVFDLDLHGVAGLRDPTLLASVRAATVEHEVVIVSVHTGVEYSWRPLAETARRMRELVDAGADLVVGHHPHVAQGVERYGGGVIFHSLGNLSFASWSHRHIDHRVLPLSLLARARFLDGALREVELIPIYTGNTTAWTLAGETLAPAFAAPRRPRGAFVEAAFDHVERLSALVPEAPATKLLRRDERLFVQLDGESSTSRTGCRMIE